MKRICLIVMSLSVFVLSCKDDEFLEVENPNNTTLESTFSNGQGVFSNLVGVYSALQLPGASGALFSNTATMLSPDAILGNFIATSEIQNFGNLSYNANNQWARSIYTDTYRIIFRANTFLDNIKVVEDGGILETERDIFTGQAKFLRALGLFWAANAFNGGNIVVPPTAVTKPEEANLPLTPRSEVFEIIISELEEAIELLDPTEVSDVSQIPSAFAERLLNVDSNLSNSDLIEAYNDRREGVFATFNANRFFATVWAAKSLLGKVYLYNDQNDLAASQFLDVIDNGNFSLVEDIADNFNEEGEFNTESIFEVPYLVSVNQENFGDGEGGMPNEGTLRATHQARAFGGFSYIFTSQFITHLYRNEVVDPDLFDVDLDATTVFNSGPERDEIAVINSPFSRRSRASIAYQNEGTQFYNITVIPPIDGQTGTFITVPSRSQVRKFMNWERNIEPRGTSGINERIIRLADVKLMYAEAVLKAEGDGGIAKALAQINSVRQRAGLVTLEKLFEGVEDSPIISLTSSTRLNSDVSGNETTFANRVKSNLPEILKIPQQDMTAENIILHLFNKERPAEFAFEGHGINWFDLRRHPEGVRERILELVAQDYEAVNVDNAGDESFRTLPQFRTLFQTDFNKGRGINTSSEVISNLYLFIPITEIQENTRIAENADLLLN